MAYRTTASTEARKDARRRHLVTTASRVFAARGYAGTTVKDIADQAAVAVGTFYLYFKSKEDILATLYDEMSEQSAATVDRAVAGSDLTMVQRFCRATAASLATYQQYRDLTRILLIEAPGINPRFQQKHLDRMERSRKRMEDVLGHLQRKGIIRLPDVGVAALAFDGTFINVIVDWLNHRKAPPLTDLAEPLAIYNLQALGIAYAKAEVRRAIEEYLRAPPQGGEPLVRTRRKEGR
jgi:AcrR family transcriptional regulator